MRNNADVVVAILMAVGALTGARAAAAADEHWLRCTLAEDVTRDNSGKETKKPLGNSSVVFVIRDASSTFFTYNEKTEMLQKLAANVQPRQVTFFDGPLSDTINRVTGAFTVVASSFHEADGTCVPIESLMKGTPKF